MIVGGSASGVLEGWKYNCAIRQHKLVYKAVMRQTWSGFQTWIAERHNERRSLVDDMLSSLQRLHNSVCKAEFQQNLCKSSFSKVAELFERYMFFLCTNNGKPLKVWVPVDWVDILLALIRALTEGEWGLHVSSIRKLIPLVLCL